MYSWKNIPSFGHDITQGDFMIVFDFGRFGRARITRPTLLEILALIVCLAFVGMGIWVLR